MRVRALLVAPLLSIVLGLPSPAALVPNPGLEERLLAVPSAAGALATSTAANMHAHYAGSPGDFAFATYMRDQLQRYGIDARLQTLTGRIDTLSEAHLSLIDDGGLPQRRFDLHEGSVAGDAGGARADAGIPFNYGSGDGDVRAPLVDAGHGLESDYASLQAANVSPRGRIALIRYGKQFRGILAARAQRHGAAGVIFFTDPGDHEKSAPYPAGDASPPTGVQRGFVASKPLAIPVLPVTYATASELLAGPARGLRAHLIVRMQRRIGQMWNTVGVLPGKSDDEVIVGGHRDAWVYGVTDNGSGIATVLECARAFGTLARSGVTFDRTIVFAGWDAEEIGGFGAQAYIRARARDIETHAVAYVNVDEVVAGAQFSSDAVAAVSAVVASTTRAAGLVHAKPPSGPAGGSDDSEFFEGPGVPTAQAGFGGTFGVYHSAFDDLAFAKAVDPGFDRHALEARLITLLVFRLSQTPRPYRFKPYVEQLRDAQAKLLVDPAVAASGPDPNVYGPLDAAIAHVSESANDYDAAPFSVPFSAAIAATRGLDRTLYGAAGYEGVPFPGVQAALQTKDSSRIAKAVAAAAAALDAAADLLVPSSSRL